MGGGRQGGGGRETGWGGGKGGGRRSEGRAPAGRATARAVCPAVLLWVAALARRLRVRSLAATAWRRRRVAGAPTLDVLAGAAGGVGVGGGVGGGRPHGGVARSIPCPCRRLPPLPPLPPWLATTAASVRPKRRLPPATGATVTPVGDEAATTDVLDVEVRVVAAGDYAGARRVAAPTGRGGTAQAQRKDRRAVEEGGAVGVTGAGRGRPWRPSRDWDHHGRGCSAPDRHPPTTRAPTLFIFLTVRP